MRAPDPTQYGWWLASRASGVTAVLLASVAVLLGLLMSGRLSQRPGMARTLRSAHEQTALICLLAIAVHGITLLGDPWMRPGVAGIAVPFTLDYRPTWTGIGIVAGWSAMLMGLSYYARTWIGTQRWRLVHRFTVVVWALAVAHAIGAGTDADTLWMRVALVVLSAPIVGLFVARLIPPPPRRLPVRRHDHPMSAAPLSPATPPPAPDPAAAGTRALATAPRPRTHAPRSDLGSRR